MVRLLLTTVLIVGWTCTGTPRTEHIIKLHGSPPAPVCLFEPRPPQQPEVWHGPFPSGSCIRATRTVGAFRNWASCPDCTVSGFCRPLHAPESGTLLTCPEVYSLDGTLVGVDEEYRVPGDGS